MPYRTENPGVGSSILPLSTNDIKPQPFEGCGFLFCAIATAEKAQSTDFFRTARQRIAEGTGGRCFRAHWRTQVSADARPWTPITLESRHRILSNASVQCTKLKGG